METIQNLIGVLESQYELYKDLYELLLKEKSYIINWEVDKMMELPKIKDTFFYKDKMLDEARKKIESRLSKEFGKENLTFPEIIKLVDDVEIREKLISLRDKILEISDKIAQENQKIKILYNTNLKLIADFFNQMGVTDFKTGYQKGYGVSSTLSTAVNKNF